MTTTPHKTNSQKEAQAIRSGLLKLIKTFALTPLQGLATSFTSVVKNHTNDNSITVCDITSVQLSKCDKLKSLWPANRWRAE